MRLPIIVAVLGLASAGAAHAQSAVEAPAPTPSAGRVSARLPITPQPNPDQRLERLEVALGEIDAQLRGLKAQGESLTGLSPAQTQRLEEALARLAQTQAALTASLKADADASAGGR